MAMDVLQWSRHYRCFPGQGGFDLAGFMGHVRPPGTTGRWSLEVFNDVFRQADPDRIAVDAMRSLMVLADAVGERRLPPPRSCAATRSWSSRWAPSPARRPSGVLEAMGFAHVGPHRSKPVQLWQQGDARVLLNHGDERTGGRPAGRGARGRERGPGRLRGARGGAARARCCRAGAGPARPISRPIAAPDGTRSSSAAPRPARTAGSATSSSSSPTGDGDAGVRAIDHVVLSQPFDYFDEAALFYRSVLGLEPHESQDLAGPTACCAAAR